MDNEGEGARQYQWKRTDDDAKVSGFGSRISGFGFRVSGLRFRVQGVWCMVWVRVWGGGWWLRVYVQGLCFRV